MKIKEQVAQLKAEWEKLDTTDKDFYSKRYYYTKKLHTLQTDFIQKLIAHFNLETTNDYSSKHYRFCVDAETCEGGKIYNTHIVEIQDVSFAFYLIKKLQSVGIDTTLSYTVPFKDSFSNDYHYIESFHSNPKGFNYHARYVLSAWRIKTENNVNNLTVNNFKEEK